MRMVLDYLTSKDLEFEVSSERLIRPLERSEKRPDHKNLEASLLKPEDSNNLMSMAASSRDIVIIVEDHTRHSPVIETLRYLKRGFEDREISWGKVRLLVASGTHREMTKIEIALKFEEFALDTEIIQHNAYDDSQMRDYGLFMDVPLQINRNIEADLKVAIGSIVPHRFSGWSGGAKMVVPGVASYETVFKSHKMAILKSSANVGVARNEFRELIDEAGLRVGLDFIINYYYGIDGLPKGCVSGNHVSAHRTGVELAKQEVLQVFDQKSDVTVISAYPSVTDFWQGGKALYTADLITKDGGDIVLVAPLEEGFGDHPVFARLLTNRSEEILSELDKLSSDDPLAYVAAYAVKDIMERKRVHIVSDTTYDSLFEFVGLKVHRDLQAVIDSTVISSRTTIVLENSYTLPQVGE